MQHSHSHSMAEPVGCEPTPEEASQNVEQQKIELETLQSIYSEEINVLQDDTEYLININPRFDGAVHLILPATNPTSSNRETCDETPVVTDLQKSTKVTHLPPVVLYVKYHCGYPSRRPPDFHVSARWLEPGLTAFVTAKLVQYFVPEYPVVFDWISYLLDELVGEYSTQQLENISSMVPKPTKSSGPSASTQGTSTQLQSDSHSSESSTSKCLSLEAAGRELEDSNDRFLSPSSASDRHPCQIFLRSSSQIDDMEEFDRYEAHKEFLQSKHECGICFMEWPGEQFSEPCHSCKQIFCKQCILEYCQVRIGDGLVSHMNCPGEKCTSVLSDPLLQSILPRDLFLRYDHLRNEVQLDSVPGMVFCPRTFCGSRVASEPDSDLAVCTECGFPFCKLCKQTWHGAGPCPALVKAESEQSSDKGSNDEPKQKKPGEQDQRRIEELKSLLWMRAHENVKPCPKCSAMIQKTGGCNKMTCSKCGSYFCWICGEAIMGYSHFDRGSGSCQLFRTEDYHPPPGAKDVQAPNDQEMLENLLMSGCPRCGQVESKTSRNNWLHCRKCQFQYCHLCRQPCFGLWHFSEYGCKRFSTIAEDLKYLKDLRKEQLAGHS